MAASAVVKTSGASSSSAAARSPAGGRNRPLSGRLLPGRLWALRSSQSPGGVGCWRWLALVVVGWCWLALRGWLSSTHLPGRLDGDALGAVHPLSSSLSSPPSESSSSSSEISSYLTRRRKERQCLSRARRQWKRKAKALSSPREGSGNTRQRQFLTRHPSRPRRTLIALPRCRSAACAAPASRSDSTGRTQSTPASPPSSSSTTPAL